MRIRGALKWWAISSHQIAVAFEVAYLDVGICDEFFRVFVEEQHSDSFEIIALEEMKLLNQPFWVFLYDVRVDSRKTKKRN